MKTKEVVIPAKAGIHFAFNSASNKIKMDSRFRGNDVGWGGTFDRQVLQQLSNFHRLPGRLSVLSTDSSLIPYTSAKQAG